MPGSRWGQILYGVLFAALLPALLVVWAIRTGALIAAPRIQSAPAGTGLVAFGFALMLWAVAVLWKRGGGLPMNAYPPARYVTSGPYRFFPHPIYLGFTVLCAGVAVTTGSTSGLWLVVPLVALGCAALVLGYERPDLKKRFGEQALEARLLPADDPTSPPTYLERLRCYLTVLLPWTILYEAFIRLGPARDAFQAFFPFEYRLPVMEWTEPFYATAYLMVFIVPIFAGSRRNLRRFSIRAWLSMAIVFTCYLVAPLAAPPRPFVPQSFLGRTLLWERGLDGPAAAFPSYHVVWACLAASALTARASSLKWLWRIWAVLIAASCVTTGMHALADVLAAGLVAFLVIHSGQLWRLLLAGAERVANSWQEWRFGPVRVINHGLYAALATLLGILIVDNLVGPDKDAAVAFVCFAGIVTAALWAQWVEGSPQLLRPLGFYGGVAGIALGALLAPRFGMNPWVLLGAFCVAAPWMQAIGRLRCLVQGCCHGAPAAPDSGIRYLHPRSRVVRLAAMRGLPLYPTPLYSILWNAVIAAVVGRLWSLHAGAGLICGLYLILSGLGRFVEEAYRGEPQTPVIHGLRLYQWIGVASVILGAFITTIAGLPAAPQPSPHASSLLLATGCALAAWFVTGVDFPESNRRFSRLA